MNIPVTLALAVFLLAPRAHAELPVSLSICAGVGPGGGHRQSLTVGGLSRLLAADLTWRHGPARSCVLSLEMAGVQAGIGIPELPRLDHVGHKSVLIGLEHSGADPGIGPYFHGGLGFGRLTTHDSSAPAPFYGRELEAGGERTASGLALGGAAGYRVVSPARQLGLAVGMRTSLVIAERARSYSLALTLGVAVHPR